MVNRIKELLNITFQNETGTRSILMNPPCHFFQNRNAPMRAVADPARKRSGNKSFLKNRIDDGKYRMMQNSVPDQSFMYVSLFRIADVEAGIWPVLVGFVFQLATEPKDILFKVPLKLLHVMSVSLIAFENVPCRKEILRRNYFFK